MDAVEQKDTVVFKAKRTGYGLERLKLQRLPMLEDIFWVRLNHASSGWLSPNHSLVFGLWLYDIRWHIVGRYVSHCLMSQPSANSGLWEIPNYLHALFNFLDFNIVSRLSLLARVVNLRRLHVWRAMWVAAANWMLYMKTSELWKLVQYMVYGKCSCTIECLLDLFKNMDRSLVTYDHPWCLGHLFLCCSRMCETVSICRNIQGLLRHTVYPLPRQNKSYQCSTISRYNAHLLRASSWSSQFVDTNDRPRQVDFENKICVCCGIAWSVWIGK